MTTPAGPSADPCDAMLWRFSAFELDVRERRLTRGGARLRLAPKAFDLLALLVARCGHLVRKHELMDALWPDTIVGEVSLTRQVCALRKTLGDSQREQRIIETVAKSGYRFREAAVPVGARDVLGNPAADDASGPAGDGPEPPLPGGNVPAARRSSPARELYLRGRHTWTRRGPEALAGAVRLFDDALALDPVFAAAHAARADALALLAGYGLPLEAFEEARASARRALALDPALADAHAALGLIAQKSRRAWEEAETEYRRALGLASRHLTALQRLGELLALRGRFAEGLGLLAEARHLDPVSPSVGADLAKACLYARRFEQAARECRAVLEIEPSFTRARLYLGLGLMLGGERAAGLGELQAFAVEEGSAYALGVLAWAEAAAGRPADARRLWATLAARPGFVPLYARVLASLAVGERGEALTLLERMSTEGHNVLGLGVSPLLDTLRGDPRFAAFVERARLVVPERL